MHSYQTTGDETCSNATSSELYKQAVHTVSDSYKGCIPETFM